MECPNCGREVESADRFCNGCGASLDAAPSEEPTWAPTAVATSELPVTEAMPAVDGDADGVVATDELPVTEPVTAAVAVTPATDELPSTEPITEVWPETAPPVEPAPAAAPATTAMPSQPTVTATMPIVPVAAPAPEPTKGFRFSLLLVIALATAVASMVAMFATIVTITSDVRLVATEDTPPEFRTGTWILEDLGDNLSIAGLITVGLMVVGGIAFGFGWRWGAGLAGGAGLSIAGLAALAVGLAQFPIDIARAFARVPTDDPFVLTITRDLGYWMFVAAGALGIVMFFASTNELFADRRANLNPWIAALGGLAVVVTAAGPLLPENQAVFSDNWYLIEGPGEAPAILLVGRLVQIGLFVIGGVLGFLCVRRWGLGLATGVSLPVIWLVVSTLFDITDDPVGFGYRNQGAVDMHVHGVTIIGTSGLLAMLILAIIAAAEQSSHGRT